MLKRFLILGLVALLCSLSLSACNDGGGDHDIDPADLPATALSFLSTYFPGDAIWTAEKDGNDYTVLLESGCEVDFVADGTWDDIDARTAALSSKVTSLLPSAARKYVEGNYPGVGISEIDREPYGYKVDLLNGLELKFDASGNFLSVDD